MIRTQGLVGEVFVDYHTTSPTHLPDHYPIGTSRADITDYVPVNGTIVFQPLQTVRTITLSVREDNSPEPDESFFVQLLSASLVSGGQSRPRMFNVYNSWVVVSVLLPHISVAMMAAVNCSDVLHFI